MKVIFQVLVMTIGFLVMPMANAAPSCEVIWAGGTLAQIEALHEKLVVGDGTQYSSYRIGQYMVEHAQQYCRERFSYMTSNTKPFGFLGWVLRNNGYLKNGVQVPETVPADWFKGIISGPGFGLFLPTERAEVTPTEASKGGIFSLAEVNAELNALRSEFKELSNQPASKEVIDDIIVRLNELGVLAPQGSVPGSVIDTFENKAQALNEGFVAFREGDLSEDKLREINERMDALQNDIAAHDSRIGALEKASKEQADDISLWKEATFDHNGRIFDLEGDVSDLGYSNYLLAAAIFLTLFILWILLRRLEKVEASAKANRQDIMQTTIDLNSLGHKVEDQSALLFTHNDLLCGDEAGENPGLGEIIQGMEGRLKKTITVANRADKGVKAINEVLDDKSL